MKRLFLLPLLVLTTCGPQAFISTLNPEILEKSLNLGTEFLLKHQTKEGNFDYEYNFVTGQYTEDDNAVRQAGTLWGLTLINKVAPSPELQIAIERGLAYFKENSIQITNKRCIAYPDGEDGQTGTQALVVLSLVEYAQPNDKQDLDEYLNCLLELRMESGQFHENYDEETGEGFGSPSPYFDGEALLALVKATKYAGYDYASFATESAEALHQANVTDALKNDPDSTTTKGFYQWGSMAFYELYTSEWTDAKYAEWTLDMAEWMIDVHKVLDRTKNTGYAYEGLLPAYELARLTNNIELQSKIGDVIDEGLAKLTTWQVTEDESSNPLALGGIRNQADGETLRIDTTQHQMHAILFALDFLY